jgi:esterase/lipase superfamily enzyme
VPTNKSFIISTRAMDGAAYLERAEPGPTQFLVVNGDTAKEYSPADAIDKDAWRNQLVAYSRRSLDEITGMEGDVLVFVHGYNNSVQEILKRTRLLQSTLSAEGWKGVVVAFDWPSDNSTLNYLEDRYDASAVAGRLVTEVLPVLVDAQSQRKDNGQSACTTNVHLLGHSTGAFVIVEAFALAEKVGELFRSDYRIGQVGFVGADVSCSSLDDGGEWAAPMFKRINRLTNYSNGFDSVLAVSNAKRLGTKPRSGRVGLSQQHHPKAVNVDTSDYFCTKDPKKSEFVGTFNHSWHIGDALWARDFAMTLEGRIDRNHLPTRTGAPALKLVLDASVARPKFSEQWEMVKR